MTNYVLLTDQLTGEYAKTFKKIELYSTIHQIDSETENEMLMDVLDTILTAQNQGKPVEKVVGNDVEQFCKDFFSTYKWSDRIATFRDSIYRLMWVMFVFQLLEAFLGKGTPKENLFLTSDIGGFIIGASFTIITMSIFCVLAKPLIFKIRWLTMAKFILIVLVLSFVLSLGFLYFFGDKAVLEVPLWLSILIPGIYIFIYKTIRAISRYRHHGSIFKEKLPDEKSFRTSIREESMKEFPYELCKRYEKINKKRSRKNKPLMTEKEFTDSLRKQHKMSKKLLPILIVGLIIFIIILVITTMLTESFADGLFFLFVLAIAEIPAAFLFWAASIGDREREIIFQACDEMGMTIPAYVKWLDEQKAAVENLEPDTGNL